MWRLEPPLQRGGHGGWEPPLQINSPEVSKKPSEPKTTLRLRGDSYLILETNSREETFLRVLRTRIPLIPRIRTNEGSSYMAHSRCRVGSQPPRSPSLRTMGSWKLELPLLSTPIRKIRVIYGTIFTDWVASSHSMALTMLSKARMGTMVKSSTIVGA